LSTIIEGRIVRKVLGENTTIKIELVDYKTVELTYNSSSDGELPDAQEWVQVDYDSQSKTIIHVKRIQAPELQEFAEKRAHFVKRQPVTTIFVVLTCIFGFLASFFWNVYQLFFTFLWPSFIFLALTYIARYKEW
jgi:hypothetical protein